MLQECGKSIAATETTVGEGATAATPMTAAGRAPTAVAAAEGAAAASATAVVGQLPGPQ